MYVLSSSNAHACPEQEWLNEGKDRMRPKLGYVSSTPGSVLKLQVNTTSPLGVQAAQVSARTCATNELCALMRMPWVQT